MNNEIPITILDFPVKQFAEELTSINDNTQAFSDLEVPMDEKGLVFSPEAVTILVTGLNTLSLLINSILVFLVKRKSGIVRIVGSSGQTLEFPYNTPPETIQSYLEIAQNIEAERLVVRVYDNPFNGRRKEYR
jgi:hypothetical protein